MYLTFAYFASIRFIARSWAPPQVDPAITPKCSMAKTICGAAAVVGWAAAVVGCAAAVVGCGAVVGGGACVAAVVAGAQAPSSRPVTSTVAANALNALLFIIFSSLG